ncbi:hypothetical protein [Homoserinimonas sp. OAct 916]|uniref:MFS transporter n=1 Tax=Homoserinimonas sp. OAct 916 TaxID=2211450 RepID=UPI0013006CA1|nr:hypothetical protein [Homoserinimonas sp. OAct 916]
MSEPRCVSDDGSEKRRGLLERAIRERPAAAWVRASPNAHWSVVATVCAGAFMGQLDAGIVSLALPPIQADFGAAASDVQRVALCYLLTLVALVAPSAGSRIDRAGRDRRVEPAAAQPGAGAAHSTG